MMMVLVVEQLVRIHHYVLTNPGTHLIYETNELPGEEGYKKVLLTAEQLNCKWKEFIRP